MRLPILLLWLLLFPAFITQNGCSNASLLRAENAARVAAQAAAEAEERQAQAAAALAQAEALAERVDNETVDQAVQMARRAYDEAAAAVGPAKQAAESFADAAQQAREARESGASWLQVLGIALSAFLPPVAVAVQNWRKARDEALQRSRAEAAAGSAVRLADGLRPLAEMNAAAATRSLLDVARAEQKAAGTHDQITLLRQAA